MNGSSVDEVSISCHLIWLMVQDMQVQPLSDGIQAADPPLDLSFTDAELEHHRDQIVAFSRDQVTAYATRRGTLSTGQPEVSR